VPYSDSWEVIGGDSYVQFIVGHFLTPGQFKVYIDPARGTLKGSIKRHLSLLKEIHPDLRAGPIVKAELGGLIGYFVFYTYKDSIDNSTVVESANCVKKGNRYYAEFYEKRIQSPLISFISH